LYANYLNGASVDAIAARLVEPVVERLLSALIDAGVVPGSALQSTWLDAADVANQLGVKRKWVYEHASELGATRIGNGPRLRLRFPPRALDSSVNSARVRPHERPAPRRNDGLLPVFED